MKKLLLTMLLLVGVGAMLSPALAVELTIGGKTVTGSGKYTGAALKKGTVSYTSNSLTLENAEINYNGRPIEISGTGAFTITVIGTCSIKGANGAIKFDKSDSKEVIISSESTARLTLESTGENFAPLNIAGSGGYTLYVLNVNMTLKRLESGENVTSGIHGGSANKMCVHNSVFSINKGTDTTIKGLNSFYLSSGAYYTSNITYAQGEGLRQNGSAYKGELSIFPKLRIEGKNVSVNEDYSIAGLKYTKSDKTITLSGHSYSGSTAAFISYFGTDDLNIKVSSNNTISMPGGAYDFIWAPNCNINITGSSYSTDRLHYSASGSGNIGFRGVKGKINIKNVTLNIATTTDYPISGDGNVELNIEKSSMTLQNNGSKPAVAGVKSCTLTDCGVNTAQSPVSFNVSKKSFTDINGTQAQKVVIGIPTRFYPVSICGQQVTDLNASNILVDGLSKGSMYLKEDALSCGLYLNNVTLVNKNTKSEAIRMNKSSSNKSLLRCNGTNVVMQEGNDAIYGYNTNLRIEGSKLSVSSTTGVAIRLYKTDLDVNLEKLDIPASVKGIWGVDGSETVNLGRRETTSVYDIISSSSAISAKTLTLDRMDFDSNKTAGCYFDKNEVKQNGGTTVKNVRFAAVTNTYDVTVGGVPVTNCNQYGIGSKYITAGGPMAVTFTNKKLTLDNATINTGKDFVNGIKNDLAGLTIQVKGTNKITSSLSGWNALNTPLQMNKNTTITGQGSLAFDNDNIPVVASDGATVTIKDANKITIASNLNAITDISNCKLVIDNSNVTVDGPCSYWQDVTWKNGHLTEPADGKWDAAKREIVDAKSATAKKVVFVDNATTVATTLSFPEAAYTATYGEAFTAPTLTNKDNVIVTYESSNTGVADVNSSTGAVTLKGAGETTITAAFAGNSSYKATSASYKLNVARAVPTVTAPVAATGLTYNGEAQQLLATAAATTGGTLEYSIDGMTWSAELLTGKDADTYTVYYRVDGGTNYENVTAQSVTATIAKAVPTVTAPVAAVGLTYSGEPQQLLITAAETTGGTLEYSTDGITWSAVLPTETEAGDYTVSYRVMGDTNYENLAAQDIAVTIAKAIPTVTAPVAATGLISNGEAQQLLATPAETTGGTLEYSTDGTTWSVELPTGIEAGDYTVYYRVESNVNYEGVAAQSITVTIAVPDGIDDVLSLSADNDAWYTLRGQKLDSRPTRKGLYIHRGRVVMVK